MWHRVDIVLTDVSEEHIASIFRVEEKRRKSASEEAVCRCATSQKTAFFKYNTGFPCLVFLYITACGHFDCPSIAYVA
jgi:hypothetical protein